MTIAAWILVAVIIVAFVSLALRGTRKRWFKVYTADPDVLLLYRTLSDSIFRGGDKNLAFRNERGNIMGFPNHGHWILKYEMIKNGEVEAVRAEIMAWRQEQLEKAKKEAV